MGAQLSTEQLLSLLLGVDSVTGLPTSRSSSGGVPSVNVASTSFPSIPPFVGTLLSTTVAGAVTITDNLQDYNDWSFIISFADATNTVLIEGSYNGTDFAPLNLLNTSANSVSATAQASIATPVLFKIGLAAGIQVKPVPLRAIRVTKGGAGVTSTTVTAIGGWSA